MSVGLKSARRKRPSVVEAHAARSRLMGELVVLSWAKELPI